MFLHRKTFIALSICIILFILSQPFPILFPIAQVFFIVIMAFILVEVFVLYTVKKPFNAYRELNEQFSLGDDNNVSLIIQNFYSHKVFLEIIDELPYQFQIRDQKFIRTMDSDTEITVKYKLRPTSRGEYHYGNINIFATTLIGLVQRRYIVRKAEMVKVFPSVLQMRKHEINIFSQTARFHGIKKIRKLGNTSEFEQIKNYAIGDNFKHINWKATSRKNELMVNQYEDEKSQQVYCIIDKGRAMKMPFNDLSLLDYAINSALIMANISLHKSDKAGLITFSDKIGQQLPAERNAKQLQRILNTLYNQKTDFKQSNFELLFQSIRSTVKGRSIIFLYTNFESVYAMRRALPILRSINRNHLLIVIFFQNKELLDESEKVTQYENDIYTKTIAGKFVNEKKKMVKELNQAGIQSILSLPDDLSIDTINKYLQIKSQGKV